MIDPRGGDDERVAQVRRSIRYEERAYWSLLIMVLAMSAVVVAALEFHLPMESAGAAAFVVLLVWVAVMFRYSSTVSHEAVSIDEDILRRTIDDQHRRWRWFYAFTFVGVGGLAIAISLAPMWIPAGRHLAGRNPLAGVLALDVDLVMAAVFAAFQVCFGPSFLTGAYRRALNDELTRAMQRSAAMFGYLVSVIALCGVFCAMVIRPQWGLAAMPGAIGAAVILPGLYFLVGQWRAGRNG